MRSHLKHRRGPGSIPGIGTKHLLFDNFRDPRDGAMTSLFLLLGLSSGTSTIAQPSYWHWTCVVPSLEHLAYLLACELETTDRLWMLPPLPLVAFSLKFDSYLLAKSKMVFEYRFFAIGRLWVKWRLSTTLSFQVPRQPRARRSSDTTTLSPRIVRTPCSDAVFDVP